MKLLLSIISFLFFSNISAQIISGTVKDVTTGQVLSAVTVYIGNSSRSTETDKSGDFHLEGFSNTSYNLIFSLVGYQLFTISSEKIGKDPLQIKLQPKDNALDPVIVQAFEKDGWTKWGKLFLDNFIGTLPFSSECIIKNQNDIKFKFHKKQNILEAIALEPIVIVNNYLGFQIRYDLVTFQYDINEHYIFYAGYPVFKDLTEGKGAHYAKVRLKRREEVYLGSMMHFMRALYSNTLEENGFQMRKMQRVPNLEKVRIDSLDKAHSYTSIGPENVRKFENDLDKIYPRDSLQYFKAVRRQPNILQILHPKLLSGNDLFVRRDSMGSVILGFKDYLYITYPGKLEIPEYYTNKIGVNGDSCITSIISLTKIDQFQLFSNGQYSPPSNILAEAYWGWFEKMCTMLPFDYKRPDYEN